MGRRNTCYKSPMCPFFDADFCDEDGIALCSMLEIAEPNDYFEIDTDQEDAE